MSSLYDDIRQVRDQYNKYLRDSQNQLNAAMFERNFGHENELKEIGVFSHFVKDCILQQIPLTKIARLQVIHVINLRPIKQDDVDLYEVETCIILYNLYQCSRDAQAKEQILREFDRMNDYRFRRRYIEYRHRSGDDIRYFKKINKLIRLNRHRKIKQFIFRKKGPNVKRRNH